MSIPSLAQRGSGVNDEFLGEPQQPGLSTCHILPPDDAEYWAHQGDVRELRYELGSLARDYAPQGHIKPAEVEFYPGAGVAVARRQRVQGVDRVPPPGRDGLPDDAVLVGDLWVSAETGEVIEATGQAKRGVVKVFSYKSRRRLMGIVNRIRKDAAPPLFITLTYPDEYTDDPRRWKRDIQTFLKRFKRKWVKLGVLWRLEVVYRKSGTNKGRPAPHFHLLAWGLKDSWILKEWVSKNWHQVVGGDADHLSAGTQVETVKNWLHMMGYVAKTMAAVMAVELGKDSQALASNVGRWWGFWHQDCIPFGVRMVVTLTERQACDLIRYMRRFAGIKSRAYKSLSCFLDVDQWAFKLGWVPI